MRSVLPGGGGFLDRKRVPRSYQEMRIPAFALTPSELSAKM